MKDLQGREIDHLRISLTNKCNLDCFYCHGEGNRSVKEMTTDDVKNVLEDARTHGIMTLKITGGEPLLRDDLLEIVSYANELGFQDIGLTTNGTLLSDIAHDLKTAGLDRVNIGCDTIHGDLPKNTEAVKEAITRSKQAGLDVKLNMVILKNVNAHEIEQMIEFAKNMWVNLQLIELVQTDKEIYEKYFSSLENLTLPGIIRTRQMQNRKRIYTDNIYVELVRPNRTFCEKCNKIRVTSDGRYKACLMKDENYDTIGEAIRGRMYGYG